MFRLFARDGKKKIIRQIAMGRCSKEQSTFSCLKGRSRREALQTCLKPTGRYAFSQKLAKVTVKIIPFFSWGQGEEKTNEAADQLKALQHSGDRSCISLLLISRAQVQTSAPISSISGPLGKSAAREDVCNALNEPNPQRCWEKTQLPISEVVKLSLLHVSHC